MSHAVSTVFAALADDTRRGIYERLLSSTGGHTATELVEEADVSRQAIVKHLQVLVRAGLATAERDGKEVRYRVVPEGTMAASAWLAQRANEWDQRIAKLEATIRATRAV
jgi:DNA-binding transcriptional ArsR family regulator